MPFEIPCNNLRIVDTTWTLNLKHALNTQKFLISPRESFWGSAKTPWNFMKLHETVYISSLTPVKYVLILLKPLESSLETP